MAHSLDLAQKNKVFDINEDLHALAAQWLKHCIYISPEIADFKKGLDLYGEKIHLLLQDGLASLTSMI